MGLYCCKSEEEEVTEQTDYNQNTYGNTYNNHEDIFKTRAPCMYGHRCPCPCHIGKGECIFKNGVH